MHHLNARCKVHTLAIAEASHACKPRFSRMSKTIKVAVFKLHRKARIDAIKHNGRKSGVTHFSLDAVGPSTSVRNNTKAAHTHTDTDTQHARARALRQYVTSHPSGTPAAVTQHCVPAARAGVSWPFATTPAVVLGLKTIAM